MSEKKNNRSSQTYLVNSNNFKMAEQNDMPDSMAWRVIG